MSDIRLANQQQAALWNEGSGPIWVEMQAVLDRMLEPLQTVLLAEAFPGPGGAVLDVGSGAGATSLAMGRLLGQEGYCLGADISAPLVAAARARAEAEGARNVAFIEADAQTHRFEPGAFDVVMSRLGVMFFEDPVAAFSNMRSAARPGAKLAFVAWRSPAENPFFTTATRAAGPFLPHMPAPDPTAPGQFAFADGEKVRRILEAAGWRRVEVRPVDAPTAVQASDLRTYVTKLGPVGLALRQADEATRRQVAEALETAYRPFVKDGAARFAAACWLVTACA